MTKKTEINLTVPFRFGQKLWVLAGYYGNPTCKVELTTQWSYKIEGPNPDDVYIVDERDGAQYVIGKTVFDSAEKAKEMCDYENALMKTYMHPELAEKKTRKKKGEM